MPSSHVVNCAASRIVNGRTLTATHIEDASDSGCWDFEAGIVGWSIVWSGLWCDAVRRRCELSLNSFGFLFLSDLLSPLLIPSLLAHKLRSSRR